MSNTPSCFVSRCGSGWVDSRPWRSRRRNYRRWADSRCRYTTRRPRRPSSGSSTSSHYCSVTGSRRASTTQSSVHAVHGVLGEGGGTKKEWTGGDHLGTVERGGVWHFEPTTRGALSVTSHGVSRFPRSQRLSNLELCES